MATIMVQVCVNFVNVGTFLYEKQLCVMLLCMIHIFASTNFIKQRVTLLVMSWACIMRQCVESHGETGAEVAGQSVSLPLSLHSTGGHMVHLL